MVGGLAPPPVEEEQQKELQAQHQVIFVLESAQLETAQVGKVGNEPTEASQLVIRLIISAVFQTAAHCHMVTGISSSGSSSPCSSEGSSSSSSNAAVGSLPPARALLHFLTALVAVLCIMQSYQLLNCDDHANYLMKHKKDPALFRPDITHQVRPPPPSIYCHGIFHISQIFKCHTPGIHKRPHMGRQRS